jgi:cytochrome c oxidase cbb3-type subunit 3
MSDRKRPWAPLLKPRIVGAAVAVLAVALALGAGVGYARSQQQGRRLLAATPDQVVARPDLVRFAVAQAKPLYDRNCSACHGPELKGQPVIGAPDLTDKTWLYGDGRVFDIELTILYGVRSGVDKSHDVTEMPAFGLRGQLSNTDIDNVVQYLLALNGRPHIEQAALLGRDVFNSGIASCYDCHGADALGNSDYGAPNLKSGAWNWGADPSAIRDSIYYGRHGVMPAWNGKLTLEQIRALAIYVYVSSHR